MILDQCPNCNAKHVQTTLLRNDNVKEGVSTNGQWRLLRCNNQKCQCLILLELESNGVDIVRVFPFVTHSLDFDLGIGDEIREDFNEAGLCLGAGCFKASMVMSRRVLQRCLKAQGCEQNRLVKQIDHAVDNNILRPAFHEVATEIRQYGNIGAHPDEDEVKTATKENAEQVHGFARMLIHEFYEIPAKVDQMRQNRT